MIDDDDNIQEGQSEEGIEEKDSENSASDGGGELSEEEKMAQEWAAMADSNDGGGQVDKTLGQDEIDSLLGIEESGATKEELRGLSAILSSSRVYYERLPMLEVVLDRMVRMLSTSLRNFTSENAEVTITKLTSYRFGDYLNSIPLPALIGVFKATPWENQGLLMVDTNLIYCCVDVLLGNRRGRSSKIEGRPFTTIERNLIERFMDVILIDFTKSFAPVTPVEFGLERMETNPAFASVARNTNATVVARISVEMEGRGGIMELALPYSTIEPIRDLLLQNFMGEKFGRDAIWESHLANKLWGTDIELEATIVEQIFNLREMLEWKVGDQVLLQATPTTPIHLQSGGSSLFTGKIGQKSGKAAIKIDEVLYGQEEDA